MCKRSRRCRSIVPIDDLLLGLLVHTPDSQDTEDEMDESKMDESGDKMDLRVKNEVYEFDFWVDVGASSGFQGQGSVSM